MVGPPGSGKSMLASRLPSILPPLSAAELLEVSMIHSIAGQLSGGKLSDRRPFRTPHHSATMAALIGGGLRARPGEASLAHHGVLFLDEFPEFAPQVLDALRQPLESGECVIARANHRVSYPARIQLVAAMIYLETKSALLFSPCKRPQTRPAEAFPSRRRRRFSSPRRECMRDIPIITFINKMDRESRDPFEILDEVEEKLALDTAPITWPIGRSKTFCGSYHLKENTVRGSDTEVAVTPVNGPQSVADRLPENERDAFIEEVGLAIEACRPFDRESFLEGHMKCKNCRSGVY